MQMSMQKLKEKFSLKDKNELPTDTAGMYVNEKIDDMLLYQKWLCPIRYESIQVELFTELG